MANFGPADIRNIALVGHSSTGKTSLGEGLLFNSGATTRLNKVDDKNSVLDFSEDEISRSITISLKAATINWNNKQINFLDTPGFPDFFGEVVSASKVTESFCIVIDSQNGVDLGTEKAWDLVKKEKMSAMFIINKMTRENIDYEAIFNDIKENVTPNAALIQLPMGTGPDFKGIIDLISGKAFEYEEGKAQEIDMPGDIKDRVETMKSELIEMVAQSDDDLMEKFFEDALSDDDIVKGFNSAIKSGKLYPVMFTDALANVGTDKVLDVIAKYMPSASDKGEYKTVDGTVKVDDAFSGFVFKTSVEKHVGDMALVRVFSGTLKAGSEIVNVNKDSNEKINQIYTTIGKTRTEASEIQAGSICVLVKLRNTKTNDSLADKSLKTLFEPIDFPKTNVSMAILPQSKGDEEKISNGLLKLSEEDPSFHYKYDPEIRQTLIHGLGNIHLEVIVNRLKDKFGVNVTLEKPRIKYRETITKTASAEGKHKKQSGGRGQFGLCNVRIEPQPRDGGFEFVDEIFGGSIPAKFVPSVEKGVREQLQKGFLAGYPVVDVKAAVYDGKFHPVDSSDIAFQIAGSLAVKTAMEQAGPILLEPIMKVDIIIPEEYMGDIMGDASTRRGRILGTEALGKNQKVKALIPEAEMYQYSSQLRSMTQGRGTYSMEFSTYEPVPRDQMEKIIEEARRLAEEEDSK